MRSQTIRYARQRLVRWDTCKVYSYEISASGLSRRAGVYGKGI